jgi:hypothetical protein
MANLFVLPGIPRQAAEMAQRVGMCIAARSASAKIMELMKRNAEDSERRESPRQNRTQPI